MILQKVATLSERRSCKGRILFVTVYNIKRKGTDLHQKGQEKGRSTRKSYEKEVNDAEGPTYEAGEF